jgi:hypothetical protein
LYPRPERTSSWNAKKEMARRRNSKRREREREREREQETASGSTKLRREFRRLNPASIPGP